MKGGSKYFLMAVLLTAHPVAIAQGEFRLELTGSTALNTIEDAATLLLDPSALGNAKGAGHCN